MLTVVPNRYFPVYFQSRPFNNMSEQSPAVSDNLLSLSQLFASKKLHCCSFNALAKLDSDQVNAALLNYIEW